MEYVLTKADGTKVPLRFDTYFLMRVGKLSGLGLHASIAFVIGHDITDTTVSGGMVDDIEARAITVAAAMDAYAKEPKHTYADGLEVISEVGLLDDQWAKMYVEVIKSVIPPAGKKKAVRKASPSGGKKLNG